MISQRIGALHLSLLSSSSQGQPAHLRVGEFIETNLLCEIAAVRADGLVDDFRAASTPGLAPPLFHQQLALIRHKLKATRLATDGLL